MFPKRVRSVQVSVNSPFRQKGATTIVAVIISIVLLTLGIALSNQISSTIRQQSIEYYGARAYLAAQTGLEVAVSRLVEAGDTSCPLSQELSTESSSVDNCTIILSCRESEIIDEPEVSSGEIIVYLLASEASCSFAQLETSRRLAVEIRQEQ